MKKKILYCMQISWYWIKQRPHFIAEGLSDIFDVTVVDRQEYKKDVINPTSMTLYHRFRLPFERFIAIEYINTLLYRIQYKYLAKNKEIIWITSPKQFKLLGECEGKTVVYDCMDDMPALSKRKRERIEIEKYEEKLYERADILFASSEHLKNHLVKKYGSREIVIVNNAIKDNISEYKYVPFSTSGINLPRGKVNMVYIGTISSWFDFDLIIQALDEKPSLILNLFGPTEVNVPKHPQIIYHGPVEHKFILGLMDRADVLVMPFVVNDLILSVNPVKLYEYVYSGKPCIAPRYGETEPFSKYVSLYSNEQEFNMILDTILDGSYGRRDKAECESFALNNTWSSRVRQIEQRLAYEKRD